MSQHVNRRLTSVARGGNRLHIPLSTLFWPEILAAHPDTSLVSLVPAHYILAHHLVTCNTRLWGAPCRTRMP